MEEENIENVLELRHITKIFPGIKANDDISLTLRKGEVHALLGENGAGKSTLMSMVSGLYQPGEGEILLNGKKVNIKDPHQASDLGIGMVHQHFMLVGVFTALENIILGVEPTNKLGFIQPKEARQKLVDLCNKFNFNINLDEKVDDMSVGEQQKVEILKMLFKDSNILIFDEPTAVLTPQEIDDLMVSIRNLAKEGKSILFISHKLDEIMKVTDRVTILRKGKCIGTLNTKETNAKELSKMMVGRDVELVTSKDECHPGANVLTINNLTVFNQEKEKETVKHVSFNVRSGEIVCLAGIEGNGQTDLIYAITGLCRAKEGEIILHNVKNQKYSEKKKLEIEKKHKEYTVPEYVDVHLEKLTIRKRSLAGLSHIPEDRQKYGLALDFSLADNIVLRKYFERPYEVFGLRNKKKINEYANEMIKKYDIRSSLGPISTVRSMSGGNQQKAIIAREMDTNCPLLIAVSPTRGLDVGAIENIHKQLIQNRDEGKAVLLVSLELDEVMNLSDRILVMHDGEIVAELNPKETTVQEIGLYMLGTKKQERSE